MGLIKCVHETGFISSDKYTCSFSIPCKSRKHSKDTTSLNKTFIMVNLRRLPTEDWNADVTAVSMDNRYKATFFKLELFQQL